MNTRNFLLNLDYKIYLFKFMLARKYVEFKLKFEKDKNERDKLLALWIYHPFSSKYELPCPSIIEDICKIEIEELKK